MTGSRPIGIYEKALPTSSSWEARLDTARSVGFDFVELSIDESEARMARLEPTSSERRAIRQAVQATGVPVKTLCLSAHRLHALGSASSATRQRSHEMFVKAIDLALELGVRIVQIAGYYVYLYNISCV